MLLGLAPGIGWHLWHAHIRGSEALWLWGGDGAGRVLLDAGEGSDLGWRVPVIEVLEGAGPGCRCCPSPWSGPGAGVRAAGAAGRWPACSPWPEPFFRCAPSSPGTATRSGCPSLSSVLRCWPGWWSAPLLRRIHLATQIPLPLAAVAASNVLVRARAAAPAALAEQLQQHRQQPWALPRPGPCAGPRLVLADGGCALAHHSDDALG